MRIKRFKARDLPEVVRQIKEEFGLSAVILNQRETGDGVEVTAGVREEDLPETENTSFSSHLEQESQRVSQVAASLSAKSSPKKALEKPKNPEPQKMPKAAEAYRSPKPQGPELGGLKKAFDQGFLELKELILDLAHRQVLSEKWRDRPELVSLYRKLLASGLALDLARDFVEKAASSQAAWGGELLEQLRQTIRPLLRCQEPELGPEKKLLALIGPSGAGKTTSLVNLAALYRQRGLKTAIVSLDTVRLGAAEQLVQYARILGLGLKVCQKSQEFVEALEIFSDKDVILVDTAARDFGGDSLAGQCLARPNLGRLLVLPATMKADDLGLFYHKNPADGVIVTKIDETLSLGNAVGFAATYLPLFSYFSTGYRTPDDFRPAQADLLLDYWLHKAESKEEAS